VVGGLRDAGPGNRELFRPAELGTAVIHRLEQVDQALAAALDGEK